MDRLITTIALPVTGIVLSLVVSCSREAQSETESELPAIEETVNAPVMEKTKVESVLEPKATEATQEQPVQLQEEEIGVNKPDTEEEIAALRERLSPLEFEVTQESGTERAFTGKYWDNKKPGVYVDIVDGKPLFSSTDKFDSGTGWPSFSRPLEGGDVMEYEDKTHGMVRVEVRSKSADSHLGHVFPYQNETGLRYCINSASLKFVPAEKLEEEGLGQFSSLFEDKEKVEK